MNIENYAHYYLNKGFTIAPAQGKIAYYWKTKPVTNLEEFQARKHEFSNLAIVPPANTIILDFDSISDFDNATTNYPILLDTPHVQTSHGYHTYLKVPYNTSLPATVRITIDNFAFDIRGLGKTCVIAPPSIHPTTNKQYKWIISLDNQIQSIPNELLNKIYQTQHSNTYSMPTHPLVLLPNNENTQKRVQGLINWAYQKISAAQPGNRHYTILTTLPVIWAIAEAGYVSHYEIHNTFYQLAIAKDQNPTEANRLLKDSLEWTKRMNLKGLPPNKK